MALLKQVTQNDRVVTSYHRILLIQSVVNSHTSISVLSYVDQDSRNIEPTESRVYKSCITYEMEYVENMTIEDAYAYLKTLPEFEGAEDI
jgi:hypothetical protein